MDVLRVTVGSGAAATSGAARVSVTYLGADDDADVTSARDPRTEAERMSRKS
jgi:hypothetical protein